MCACESLPEGSIDYHVKHIDHEFTCVFEWHYFPSVCPSFPYLCESVSECVCVCSLKRAGMLPHVLCMCANLCVFVYTGTSQSRINKSLSHNLA